MDSILNVFSLDCFVVFFYPGWICIHFCKRNGENLLSTTSVYETC